ncbi:MAG: pilus assembly protein PilM [Puniceicoccales bacterium]|jgi:type IV pilus assembly protein PilM|nr:pilus assembly protein PilM [Puniceicoccales bacterium]
MSSPNPIVVNCGATHVSAAVFSAARSADGGRRLTLEKFFVQTLSYDYTDEGAWLEALAFALKGIVGQARLSGSATVIVPGYRLLTKNIKVAQVEQARQKQIIAFSAQENLPDAAEMVWDSQIISTDGVEAEVALFAHKRADATEFTEAICSTGLKPESVDAATLLDYQCYRLAQGGEIAGNALIINIGARSTNLTFATPEGFGIQNISIGGNLLTQSISDTIGETFARSEAIKQAYFSSPESANLAPGVAAQLDARAQDFTKRLAQDINRRVINHRRQNAGATPERLVLTGRGSLLPGLAEYLAEALKLPVEFLDPLLNVRLGKAAPHGLPGSATAYQVSECVGEAARLVLERPVGVNLIPREIAARLEFAKKKPWLVLAALFAAAAPLPVGYHFYEKHAEIDRQLDAVRTELDGSAVPGGKEDERDGKGYRGYGEKIKKLCLEIEDIDSRSAVLKELGDARLEWFELLTQIQAALIQEPVLTVREDPADDPFGTEADTENAAPAPAAKSGWAKKRVWIESLAILRNQLPPSDEGAAKPVAKTAAGAKTPAKSGSDAKKGEPPAKRVTVLKITVKALLPEVSPDGAINAAAATAKFEAVEKALKQCDTFVKDVRPTATASQGEEKPNLPRRTFLLTLKPEQSL